MGFLNKLHELPLLHSGNLVTLDVSLLYTNIPHDEGVKACAEVLDHLSNRELFHTEPLHSEQFHEHFLQVLMSFGMSAHNGF